MAEADRDIIRRIERTVLDEAHKKYAILRESIEVATLHLLRVTLHVLRDENLLGKRDAITKHLWYAKFLKAVSFSFRWVYLECPRSAVTSKRDSRELDEAAQDLLFTWGMPYTELATEHIAWTNDLLPAKVITDEKVIVFGPAPAFDLDSFIGHHLVDLHATEDEASAFPLENFKLLFNDWQRHAEWTSRGLEFDPTFVRNHERFPEMINWTQRIVFPELDENVLLGGYTLGDIRRFLAVILTIAECVTTLESLVDERVGRNNGMGSWIFTMTAERAVEWYCSASAMPDGVVRLILDDLTGDPTRFHFSVSTSPILRIGDDLLIGQRLLAALRPSHFVARALTAGSGRRRYDHVSTLLERARLDIIEARLRQHGLHVLREHTFVQDGASRFTPDLLVWDEKRLQVIVIDFKNSLAASGAAEVANRMREFRKGITQVENYLIHFRKQPSLLTAYIGERRCEIKGVLLFWAASALPVPRHPEIVLENWATMRSRLGTSGEIALSELLPAYKDDRSAGFNVAAHDISVGEWTYRRFHWQKLHVDDESAKSQRQDD